MDTLLDPGYTCAVYTLSLRLKELTDSMGLTFPQDMALLDLFLANSAEILHYTHKLIMEATPGLMRRLRQDDPRADEFVRLAAFFHQFLWSSKTPHETEADPAGPGNPMRTSGLDLGGLRDRAQREHWCHERYTRELMALKETRPAARRSE